MPVTNGTLWPLYQFMSSQGTLLQIGDEEIDARSAAVPDFSNLPFTHDYYKAGELVSTVNWHAVNGLKHDAQHRIVTGAADGFASETASCAPTNTARGFCGEKRSNGAACQSV